MKRLFSACAILALALFATVLVAVKADTVDKVTVCHYSIEDSQFVTVVVGPKAADAHLAQHNYGEGQADYLGACVVE